MNIVPISLIETALNSSNAAALLRGSGTHDAALRFVGEVVSITQNSDWISAIVAGFLPANYSGNTLDEIPRMVSDSVKNGFASPLRKNMKEEKLSAAQQANLILSSGRMELFHTAEGIGFVAFTNQNCLSSNPVRGRKKLGAFVFSPSDRKNVRTRRPDRSVGPDGR